MSHIKSFLSFAVILYLSFIVSPLFMIFPDNYIVPEKAPCLGCPEEIDQYSDDLRGPLTTSISKYNTMSDSTHLFTLHSVGHATRQVEMGCYKNRGSGKNVSWRKCFYLLCVCFLLGACRFKVPGEIWYEEEHLRKGRTQRPHPSVCPWWKQCGKHENKACLTFDIMRSFQKPVWPDVCLYLCVQEFANCNSTVDVAPWRHEPPQIQIECEQGALASVRPAFHNKSNMRQHFASFRNQSMSVTQNSQYITWFFPALVCSYSFLDYISLHCMNKILLI